MSNFKEGDWVKTVAEHKNLALAKGELGRVRDVDEDGTIEVGFTAFDGTFDYSLWVAASDIKKVGTKLKKKRMYHLEPGDLVVLDGDGDTEFVSAIVGKVKNAKYQKSTGDFVVTGKDFRIVSTYDDSLSKVPVVV